MLFFSHLTCTPILLHASATFGPMCQLEQSIVVLILPPSVLQVRLFLSCMLLWLELPPTLGFYPITHENIILTPVNGTHMSEHFLKCTLRK